MNIDLGKPVLSEVERDFCTRTDDYVRSQNMESKLLYGHGKLNSFSQYLSVVF